MELFLHYFKFKTMASLPFKNNFIMKVYFSFIIALAAVGFTACNSSEKSDTSSSTVADEKIIIEKDSNTDASSSTIVLGEVYDSYFALIDALTNDDGEAAQTAAKVLHQAIVNVPKDEMNAIEQDLWDNYNRKLSYDTKHIMDIYETPHQREHLVSLSKNMFEVMQEIEPGRTVYYQECPMYDNNKGGVWVSEHAQIKNPYFGQSMLDCGETIDSIKN